MSDRDLGKDVIHEVRRGLGHAAGIPGRANAPPLARKGHQKVMPAVVAVCPGKTVRQNAARQVLAEVPLDILGNRISVRVGGVGQLQPRLQMPLYYLVRHGALRPSGLVNTWAWGELG